MINRPNALPVQPQYIPQELKDLKRWVLWKHVRRKNGSGESVWAKLPLTTTGQAASTTDPATWTSYDDAIDTLIISDCDGIGVVLGDDLNGIDLDDSRDPETGALSALAQEVLERVDGYAEVSPSGTGIKIFSKTNLDASRAKKEVGVELYKDRRYFTVTGHKLDGHEHLPEAEQDLTWFVQKIWREEFSAPVVLEGDAADRALALYKAPLEGWDLNRVAAELLPHLDPDCGYDEWLRVGQALHHQGQGDTEWLAAWDAWSAPSGKYIEGECERKWRSFKGQRTVGHGAVTLASLLHKTKDARIEQSVLTRQTLEGLIEDSSDFDELTKVILRKIYEANLPESDTSILLKQISQKTKVSLKSLTHDGAQFRRVDANQQQRHLAAARAVIGLIGRENILFTRSTIWRWSDTGVWMAMDDREAKQLIHQVAANTKLTANVVNSILDMLKTEVLRADVSFDAHKDTINCRTGELKYLDYLECWIELRHEREHYLTAQIPISYDPQAKAPRFEKFLDEVFEGDTDSQQKRLVVEESLGYTLLASCHLEKFLMLIGSGANGKSVLLAIVAELVGSRLVSAVQPSNFAQNFQRGHLVGKLANIVTEIAQGAEIADDKLKSLVSGELTTAENKFKSPFDFKPIATHWFGTNHLPRTRDFSDALFRRAIVLEFNNRFEGQRRDVGLTNKLIGELPGILNIALKGLARLLERGYFTEPPSSEAIKDSWRLETDQVRQFVEMTCIKDASVRSASSALFSAYLNWADRAGIKRTLSQNAFSSRLKSLGFATHRGTNGERQILGLKPKEGDFFQAE